MKKYYATIGNIKYGETPMGTGPRGGHRGEQWQAEITIGDSADKYGSVRKRLKIYKNVIIKVGLQKNEFPTQKDLEDACKGILEKFKEEWPKEQEEMKKEKEQRDEFYRNQNKLNKIARNLVVCA